MSGRPGLYAVLLCWDFDTEAGQARGAGFDIRLKGKP
jgi:hypothetical protein